MLDNNQELKDVNENELIVAEIEVEELEQRLEMSCTRCCIELN
ncbi:hypothetical protein tloyanaT_24930 [Thalassotalea loyana]|uniref:Uncharacterized protein n=1 Tax=Thalassotalea loyana TaxID=280483 RepID=A0ABQ6HFG6_9GAMM|nr:hypothetical protein [Thalassotalea loyana]GLX86240.1 hypothetical protein tloyanaT_24930 [Thalassotalea loyana]